MTSVEATVALEQLRGRTVVVTGGTGFTGAVLVKKLVEAGANVRAPFGDRMTVKWTGGLFNFLF